MQRTLELTRPPFDYDKFAVTNTTVVELDTTKRANNCRKVFLTVETNSIRWRVDGSDPDANDGHVLTSGSSLTLSNKKAIKQFAMISTAGAGSTVIVTYYH